MKRPSLVHFQALKSYDALSLRCSITLMDYERKGHELLPLLPYQAFKLLKSNEFRIKIVGRDHHHNKIFDKSYDSDDFGNFMFKIPLVDTTQDIHTLEVYEVRTYPGIEFHLGSFLLFKIPKNPKVIICDFDKTLVDTRFSTTKEIYESLTKPLDSFPILGNSLNMLKDHIERDFNPFILSASPHFYEGAIRD